MDKILVAEDHLDTREMYVAVLSLQGYETESSPDTNDALAKLTQDTRVMIVDQNFPGYMTGLELLAKGHERHNALAGIVLSGDPLQMLQPAYDNLKRSGMKVEYLFKPVDLDKLIEAVARVIGR